MFCSNKIYQAYINCRKNKRLTHNALKFEINFGEELQILQKELQNHTYRPGRSVCFVVTYPKPREIFAADFRDRIVHHLLISILERYFDKRFIYSSFACRKEKGTLKATTYLDKLTRQISNNYTKQIYYGQFDIKSFFCSINKNTLEKIILRSLAKDHICQDMENLIWLIKTIIFHNPTENYYIKGDKELLRDIPHHKTLFKTPKNQGLPIGNLTSQFFANLYLNEMDQYIKRDLKMKYYLRYADDFIILHEELETIKLARDKINEFLHTNLQLELHPSKDKYGYIYSGIDFVGYLHKPNYRLSRNRVVINLKTKLHLINQGYFLITHKQEQKLLPLSTNLTTSEIVKILAMINSYYGHFKHANCYNLRKNIYKKHFGVLQKYLKPKKNYKYFKIRHKKDEPS